ncbi:choloylglycine hydrolase family protein [Lactiplantibacillus pentosus]|uniref:choloylglycine hydrolase family protein n=1 Tax=Lactiplantibacillus pentosus TaxID=1589 RepID=UPI0021A2982D|nr:choloylglycine hydrolase family protein [Lactiplantibacillus pentosus]MCT3307045.1 linear amide C-N hydrolase [Lactiplantibacillus pentosus]
MCTSLTYTNSHGGHFLARTMDFNVDFDTRIMFMPRHYRIAGDLGDFKTTYGFIGAGRQLNHEIFTDGVNECGVSIVALYFPNHAIYQPHSDHAKIELAPHDFVTWALGNISSVADLRDRVKHLQLISSTVELINEIPPLHFMVSDASGETAVLEPTSGELHLINNPVGVLTNSPNLKWQLQNLSKYGTLTNTERTLNKFVNYQPGSQGPGTGALGLPGDYTSMSRFARTVFLKHYAQVPETTTATVNLLQHILNAVTIPKGIKVSATGQATYTEYRSYMDLNHQTYALELYENPGVLQQVNLTDQLLEHQTIPLEYALSRTPHVQLLTADVATLPTAH